MSAAGRRRRGERGAGLFIVILIAAGLAAIGLTLVSLTSMGPRLSGGLRYQEQALNAAEAGFDMARAMIDSSFTLGTWPNFEGHYLTQPTGIDQPMVGGAVNPGYFRRQTDQELLALFDTNNDGTAEVANLLFFNQTFALTEAGAANTALTATAFLINPQAGSGALNNRAALMVVIGVVKSGTRVLATTRLEIEVTC